MPKNNNTLKDSWFDTPFYHILYKNRDYKEAEIFSTELIKFLDLPIETKILDLACGQGRHSVNLNKMGVWRSNFLVSIAFLVAAPRF